MFRLPKDVTLYFNNRHNPNPPEFFCPFKGLKYHEDSTRFFKTAQNRNHHLAACKYNPSSVRSPRKSHRNDSGSDCVCLEVTLDSSASEISIYVDDSLDEFGCR
jgi:hypothetical protein